MSERFAKHERELCQMFASAVHGPKRNGLFAVWLIFRVAGDALLPSGISERGRKRRAEALGRRLASLTLPSGLRTAVRQATDLIAQQPLPPVAEMLRTLEPRVRETLGGRAAAVVRAAAEELTDQGGT